MNEDKPLKTHAFNKDGYCNHCGVNMNITVNGEPCPALNVGHDANELVAIAAAQAEPLDAEVIEQPSRLNVQPYKDQFGSTCVCGKCKPPAVVNCDTLKLISETQKLLDSARQSPTRIVLWLALQTQDDPTSSSGQSAFQIIGLYENELLAIAACRTPSDCIGPQMLNVTVPREPHEWPGAYYPLFTPPVVIGNLEDITAVPVGHVVIGEHGEAYWRQEGVTEEQHLVPGTCGECGSGPVEGQPGTYVLPHGWPYCHPCRTCERRARQLWFNAGFSAAASRNTPPKATENASETLPVAKSGEEGSQGDLKTDSLNS